MPLPINPPPGLDYTWVLDPASVEAMATTPFIHEYNKVFTDDPAAGGQFDHFGSLGLWIEYPNAGSGPGAYGSVWFSGFPDNFARKGYIYYGFVEPGAVPLYENLAGQPPGQHFTALFDTADEFLGPFPQLARRWTSVVPDPVALGGDPAKGVRFTFRVTVSGSAFEGSQRALIENYYRVRPGGSNDWPYQASDPALDYVTDAALHMGYPIMVVELPGQGVQQFHVSDFPRMDRVTLWEATGTTNLGAPGYANAYVFTKRFDLPPSAVGQPIAVQTMEMAPADNPLSAYMLYGTSGPFNAEWEVSPVVVTPPPPPPGVVAGGEVKTGVLAH